jgi:hypothetical protein
LTLAGQSFTSFQWDILLLEVCFTAMFLAPRTWRPKRPLDEPVPSRAGLWLVRLLLFKLMFLSGAVKLLSMDPAWWRLEALDVHYFTQPLPTWTAWYAHQLPAPFQRSSVLVMFAIEMVLPFAIFWGRIASRIAAAGIALLMGMIALTGNYNFFNLLTVVLCIPLLDDELLARGLPSRIRAWIFGSRRIGDTTRMPAPAASPRQRIVRALRIAAASALVLVSALTFVRELVRTAPERTPGVTGWLLASGERWLLGWGSPWVLAYTDRFHTVSGYGLFRSMTTERPEIVIEGSSDGIEWREYGFRWKPGDPLARPRFVEPHQPRLDWQMWFAALGPARQRSWLETLMRRLLEGEPTVLRLMGHNPFEQGPPRHVRLVYYAYTFTDRDERRQTGAWWKRDQRGLLTPRPLSLDDFTR